MERRNEEGGSQDDEVQQESGDDRHPRDRAAEDAPNRAAPRPPPEYVDPVDNTLADSFPASDPPSWAGR